MVSARGLCLVRFWQSLLVSLWTLIGQVGDLFIETLNGKFGGFCIKLLGNVDVLWTGALLVCDIVFVRNLLGEVGALCMYVKVLCSVRLGITVNGLCLWLMRLGSLYV